MRMITTEFEKKAIWTNVKAAQELYEDSVERAKDLNRTISDVEKFIGQDFDITEKQTLIDKGYDYVMEQIREKYKFPEASDEFNLKALGLNPSRFVESLDLLTKVFRGGHFKLTSKGISVTQGNRDTIYAINTYYTKNEAQNKALETAKKVCLFLNENKEEYLKIAPYHPKQKCLFEVAEGFGFLEVEKKGDDFRFIPSKFRITNIN